MTKLGSRKLNICSKVTKMGSIIGHRIDYNGVGVLRGQRHIPTKYSPKLPPPPEHGSFTWFYRQHDCERRSSSRPSLLARAWLYYLAHPTKTAMLRRLVCAVCPWIQKAARVDVFKPSTQTRVNCEYKQPHKSQLFSIRLWSGSEIFKVILENSCCIIYVNVYI